MLSPRGWAGFAWRRSQRHLLDLCGHVTGRRRHVCAPPGAGKTLVGLELARRATKDRVAPFAAAVGDVVPGTVLLRAGTGEAAERTLAATRTRPGEIRRTLRWT